MKRRSVRTLDESVYLLPEWRSLKRSLRMWASNRFRHAFIVWLQSSPTRFYLGMRTLFKDVRWFLRTLKLFVSRRLRLPYSSWRLFWSCLICSDLSVPWSDSDHVIKNETLSAGVLVPLFPWNKSLSYPVPEDQNLDFLRSLFPKIAFIPLIFISLFPCFPEINTLFPLFPKMSGRASLIFRRSWQIQDGSLNISIQDNLMMHVPFNISWNVVFCSFLCIVGDKDVCQKVYRKVQEEAEAEANPRHQEEEKKWHRLTCA